MPIANHRMRGWLIQLVKEFGKAIIAIVLVVGAMIGYAWFAERPTQQFCSDIVPSSTPESVISLARLRNLPVHDYPNEDPHLIVVVNHDSPFFRFACRVTFSNGVAEALTGADD